MNTYTDTYVTCTCGVHYINRVNKLVHTRRDDGVMLLVGPGKLPQCAQDVVNGMAYAEDQQRSSRR